MVKYDQLICIYNDLVTTWMSKHAHVGVVRLTYPAQGFVNVQYKM